jgi:hypothetical protein
MPGSASFRLVLISLWLYTTPCLDGGLQSRATALCLIAFGTVQAPTFLHLAMPAEIRETVAPSITSRNYATVLTHIGHFRDVRPGLMLVLYAPPERQLPI